MEKRERLLYAAAELFTSRGIQNTSTAAISRHAGVATGTLFNYFSSKKELIEQLYALARDSMMAATSLPTVEVTAETYEEGFRFLWRRGIEWGCENPTLFWFFEEISRSAYRAMDDTEITWLRFEGISRFIREGVAFGIIRDIPVELIHTMLLSTISGIVAEILVNGADREEYITESMKIVWKALERETR